MSLKSEFWEWVTKKKKLSEKSIKDLKKLYVQEHKQTKFYNFLTADNIKNINTDGRLDLYYEFMLEKAAPKKADTPVRLDKKEIEPLQESLLGESADDTAVPMQRKETAEKESGNVVSDEKEADGQSETQGEAESAEQGKGRTADINVYLGQCADELTEFVNMPQEKEKNSDKKKIVNAVFDLSTAQLCDLDSGTIAPMVKYVGYNAGGKLKNIFPRSVKSFVYDPALEKIYSTVSDLDKNGEGSSFIQRSIADTSEFYEIDTEEKSICLVPDTLRDFGDNVKSQLRTFKGKVIPIPRSIAAAYTYAESVGLSCGSATELTVYDFNFAQTSETHIFMERDAEGSWKFTRKARRIREDLTYSLDAVLRAYMRAFEKENRMSVPKNFIDALVESRDILSPLWGKGDILLNLSDGIYKKLDYNENRRNVAAFNAVANYRNLLKAGTAYVLTDLNYPEKGFAALPQLCVGCKQILQRIREGKVIWNEYLPELSLEVIKNGRFQVLQLIKRDNSGQNITENSMEERISLSVDDGIFELPAGKSEIYLPLKREEFGNYKQDKLAKFSGKGFPLDEPLKVRLELSYSYGEPDSYLLKAVGMDESNFSVQSQWCDSSDEKITEVVWSDYDENKQIYVEASDIHWMNTFFQGLYDRLSKIFSGRYTLNTKPDNDYESNLLTGTMNGGGEKCVYRHNLLKKITEDANYTDTTKEILLNFFASQTFAELFDYLIDPGNSRLDQVVEQDVQLQKALEKSILNFVSNLGVFYRIGSVIDKSDPLLDLFVKKADMNQPMALINASRCISYDAGIMEILNASALNILKAEKLEPKTRLLRNISSVCWYNKSWIFDLMAAGAEIVPALENAVWEYMVSYFGPKAEEDVAREEIQESTLKVRDVMELALAVCRLRKNDKRIFDPNDTYTKDIVAAIKRVDELVHDPDIHFQGNKKFVSRVEFDRDEKKRSGLGGMSDPCYLLLMQLIGKKVTLLGFSEKDV